MSAFDKHPGAVKTSAFDSHPGATSVSPEAVTSTPAIEPAGQASAFQAHPGAPASSSTDESRSVRDIVSGLGSLTLGGFADAAAGTIQSITDLNPLNRMIEAGTGAEVVGPGVEGLRDFGTDMRDAGQAQRPDGGLGAWAYDVAGATANMAPSVLATMITRNPNLGLGAMGTQVFGDSYNASLKEGASEQEALMFAARQVAYEIGPEKAFGFFDRLVAGQGGVKGWLIQGVAEAASELVTSSATQADEVLIQGEELGPLEDRALSALYDASVGAGMGLTLGAGTLARGPEQAVPEDVQREIDQRGLEDVAAEQLDLRQDVPIDQLPQLPGEPTDAEIDAAIEALLEERREAESEPEAPAEPEIDQAAIDALTGQLTPEPEAPPSIPVMDAPQQQAIEALNGALPEPVELTVPVSEETAPVEPVETEERRGPLSEEELEALDQQAILDEPAVRGDRYKEVEAEYREQISDFTEEDFAALGATDVESALEVMAPAIEAEVAKRETPYPDVRMKRDGHRAQLEEMSRQIVKGGNVGVATTRTQEEIDATPARQGDTFTTKSENPMWFQNKPTGHSVEETKATIAKALRGERLGARQQELIEYLNDVIQEERWMQAGVEQAQSWREIREIRREQTIGSRLQAAEREFGNLEGMEPAYIPEAMTIYEEAWDEYTEEVAERTEERDPEAGAAGREDGETRTGLIDEPTAQEVNRDEERRRDEARNGIGEDFVPVDQGEGELFAGNTPGERPDQGDVFAQDATPEQATADSPRRLVSDSAAEKAKEIIDSKKGQLNSGIDPEMMGALTVRAAWHIENGVRSFAEFAKRMIEEFGDAVRPHLTELYSRGQNAYTAAKAVTEGETGGKLTSLQNEVVDAEREARGLEKIHKPVQGTWEDTLADARRILADTPGIVRRLTARVLEGRGVALSNLEGAVLLARKREILNEIPRLADEGGPAAQQAYDLLTAELSEIDQATERSGSITGAALQFRKALINEQFEFEAMVHKATLELGKPPTKKDLRRIKKRADEILEKRKKLEEAEDKAQRHEIPESQVIFDQIIADRKKRARKLKKGERFKTRERIRNEGQQDVADAIAKINRMAGRLNSNPMFDPDLYAALGQLARGIVKLGYVQAAEFSEQLRDKLGGSGVFEKMTADEIEQLHTDALGALEEELIEKGAVEAPEIIEEAAAHAEAGDPIDNRTVFKLAKAFIEQGMDGESEVMAAVHQTLVEFYPELTERDVRRAFTNYGKAKYPSQEYVQKRLREMRTLVRLQESIDRLEEGLLPLRTGPQRDKATAEVRERQQLLNDLRKEHDAKYPQPPTAEQLAGINQARITRLQNRILELEKQIQTGEAPERRATPEDSPEVEQLKKKIEILQDTLRKIEEAKNPPKTEEQKQFERLSEQKERLDRILENQEAATPKQRPEPLSERNKDLQDEVDALRKSVAAMRREMKGTSGQNKEQRRQAKLVKQLEKDIAQYEARIRAGDFSPLFDTTPKWAGPQVEALRKLRDQRRKIFEKMKRAQRPVLTREERINRQRKASLEKRIAEYRRRIREKDYSPNQKPAVVADNKEVAQLRYEVDLAKEKFLEDLIVARWRGAGWFRKGILALAEVINLQRAVITAVDLSAMLRQGGWIFLAHPSLGVKNFKPMMRAAASKRAQHEIHHEIQKRENFGLYKQAGLELTEIGPTVDLTKQEEKFMSRFAEKVPVVAGSQRAYVTFLNKLRVDAFDALVLGLTRNGRASMATQEELEAIANFVNVATGRGVIGAKSFLNPEAGKGNNAIAMLSTIFFAPRYVASRFNLLFGQPFYGGSARTRKLIAEQYARYLVGVSAVLGLAWLAAKGYEDEDNEEDLVQFDPTSSDFLKVRFGDTRVDLMSGMIQPIVLLGRLISGTKLNSRGQVVPLRQNYRFHPGMDPYEEMPPFGDTGSTIIGRFTRSKLAPTPGSVLNLIAGENVVGQPTDLGTEAMHYFVPLTFTDGFDVLRENGLGVGAAIQASVIFGAGVSVYGDGGWSAKQGQIEEILDTMKDEVSDAPTVGEADRIFERYQARYPWLLSEANLQKYAFVPANFGRWDREKEEFIPYRAGELVKSEAGNPKIQNLPDFAKRTPATDSPRRIIGSAVSDLRQGQPTLEEILPAAPYSERLQDLVNEKGPDHRPGPLLRRRILRELDASMKDVKASELDEIRDAGG